MVFYTNGILKTACSIQPKIPYGIHWVASIWKTFLSKQMDEICDKKGKKEI